MQSSVVALFNAINKSKRDDAGTTETKISNKGGDI